MLLLILQPTATVTNKQNSYFSFPNISKMRDQTLGVCEQNQVCDPQIHFVIRIVPITFSPFKQF